MKKYTLLFLILLLHFILGASVYASEPPIRFGVYQNSPLVFMDEDESASGIFVDVLEYIAAKEGWTIEYVPGNWADLLSQLEHGEIDLIGAIAYTEARSELFDFSAESVITNWGQVYTQSDAEIATILDLEGKTIALLKGDTHAEAFKNLLESFNVSTHLIEVEDYPSVFGALQRGEADAGVINRLVAIKYVEAYDVRETNIIFNPVENRYASTKGVHQDLLAALDANLQALKADDSSVYYQSLDHWFGGVSRWQMPRWMLWAGLTFGGLLLTFAIASLVLRFQVRAKTQQLQSEVSERKRAEEILYKSEERGRLFMDSATDAFSIWDSELNLVDCNEVRMKMYFPGLRKEEVTGKNIKELHPHFWGTDRYKDFLAVMKTGKPLFVADAVYSEDSFSRPESEQRHIVVQAFKVGDGLGVINTDITERKKAEEEIEKLAKFPSENPNPVLRVAKDGSILYTNDAGLSLLDVWGCNQGQPLPDKWRKFISSVLDSGSIKDTEVEVNDRLLSLSFIPVADTDYVNVYGLDITKRKQAEKEKAQLEQQVNQSQRLESIGRLTGGVAHDLNNMLTPILGFGEILLEKSSGDEERREQLEEIVKAGRRARDLVRQLLAFSRKQTLEFKNIDLNTLLKDFEKLLRSTIREDITFRLIPAGSLPLIRGDIGQLEQVVMNLVVNAQDAMPDGGELTIETDLVELDESYAAKHTSVIPGPHVMLVVSDIGCGMDEEIREHIFEPFFTTKEKGRGTGLGLSTVYGIVKQHGGNIWVYSEPGKGTTFKVYLPLSRETQVEQKTEGITHTAPRGYETILLAEDDEIVRKLAMTILEQSGYTVLTAKNGIDALQVLKMYDGPVHMLLTDVVMPEMNGKELFNLAVKKLPDLKVLYMSGYTSNVIAHSGVLDEGITFIQKPFTVHDLAAKVREVLD